MAMDLTTAQAILDELIVAYRAGRHVGGYALEGRSVQYRTLKELRHEIDHWQRVVNSLTAQARGVRNAGVSIATWT